MSEKDCNGCLHIDLTYSEYPCDVCSGDSKWEPMGSRIDNIGQNGDNDGKGHYNAVTKPKHYMLFPDLESIDAIQKVLTEEEFRGFLKGNSLKYRFRAGKKDALEQDIAKAEQYEGML